MEIPEGWKLVPLEATEAMIEAAFEFHQNGKWSVADDNLWPGFFKAMAFAAPAPPGAEKSYEQHLLESYAKGLKKAEEECERHATFCHDEAQNGGNFKYLMARSEEARYNAQRIKSFAAAPPGKDG